MKRNLILLVAVVLTLSFTMIPSALATQESIVKFDKNLILVEEQSNEEYNKILNEYSEYNDTGKLVAEEKIIYADYYAGAYLDESKELVVLVTNGSQKNMQELKDITGNANLIIKERATYSYNYLRTVESIINNYMLKNFKSVDKLANAISGVGLYDDKNRIIVFLSEYNDNNIKLFKETICDSDAVLFEKSIGDKHLDLSIKAGQHVTIESGGYSVGFKCDRHLDNGSTETGFVTAAHSNAIGDIVKVGSTIIGEVTARKYSGSVDAAFVKITNSSYTGSNAIYGTSYTLYSGGYSSPAVGSTIYKTGYAGGTSSGTIISTSFSGDCGGAYLTNQSQANYTSSNGDSGGIVYSSGSTKYIVGTHRGTQDGYRIYIKGLNIVSDLNVTN